MISHIAIFHCLEFIPVSQIKLSSFLRCSGNITSIKMSPRMPRNSINIVDRPEKDLDVDINPDTGRTPPGYNQSLRHESRIVLALVGVFLWLNYAILALCCAIFAVILLHLGTSYSYKNWKWRLVAWGNLLACGTACYLQSSISLVDEEKAYNVHLKMQLVLYGIETFWSVFLWIIIGITFLERTKAEKATKMN